MIVNYGDLGSGIDLKELLRSFGLVHITDAEFTIDEFADFAKNLGEPLKTEKHTSNEFVQMVSHDGLFETGDVDWHNDWSYGRGSYYGTVLYNIKGGHLADTTFCDMTKAPRKLKDKYRGKMGEYFPPQRLQSNCFTEKQIKILKRMQVRRPFVQHWQGKELLYCSLGTINEDFPDIREFAEQNSHTHKWKEGDILIWDNMRMMHKRNSFTGERTLWRVQFAIGTK